MFLPPPLKSSAAMAAASTEPIPLVSWNSPEISLSTPMRTMLSDISALAVPQARHTSAARIRPFMFPLPRSAGAYPGATDECSGLPIRQAQDEAIQLARHLDLTGQTAVR